MFRLKRADSLKAPVGSIKELINTLNTLFKSKGLHNLEATLYNPSLDVIMVSNKGDKSWVEYLEWDSEHQGMIFRGGDFMPFKLISGKWQNTSSFHIFLREITALNNSKSSSQKKADAGRVMLDESAGDSEYVPNDMADSEFDPLVAMGKLAGEIDAVLDESKKVSNLKKRGQF